MKELKVGDVVYYWECAPSSLTVYHDLYLEEEIVTPSYLDYYNKHIRDMQGTFSSEEEAIYAMIFKLCRLLKEGKSDFRDLEE